jgi:hypothetical protein
LHLYGNLDSIFYSEVLSKYKNVIIHQPLPQLELHQALSNYDIGLALDIANDENRDLAITNKILAYLQAGLYILASDISAHQYILNQYADHGKCFADSKGFSKKIFNEIAENILAIRAAKTIRFNAFKNNNWEQASGILNDKWSELLF